MKLKLIAKKVWLYSQRFWWALVLGLGFLVAFLVWLLTKNGAFVATVMDLMEVKRNAHDDEMETLAHIHNTEIAEKNARLEEHQKRLAELREEFKTKDETLDKEKEAALKDLVDESYNDPEKLSREIAALFGLEHG